MPFKARIFALDSIKFESDFVAPPQQGAGTSDEILARCIQQCQLFDWSDELDKPLGGALPSITGIGSHELAELNDQMNFLTTLQGEGTMETGSAPWWIAGVRPQIKVVVKSPVELTNFSDALHRLKLLEVTLGNVSLGAQARKLTTLCKFLDSAAEQRSWLLTLRF